ncbi:hypothetical protein BSLG_001123 [Batrachochytrium salamandrivorans]|nr:hypothetical protein BSLG_006610 [Batrachochytrium salamandrivorans]KAJ1344313.1 hypothetical protein BSLG_001123 [Batrachochytrium salamandrivorans]
MTSDSLSAHTTQGTLAIPSTISAPLNRTNATTSLEQWIVSMNSDEILDSIDSALITRRTNSNGTTVSNSSTANRHSLTQFASIHTSTCTTMNSASILQTGYSPVSTASSSSSIEGFPKLLRRGHPHRHRNRQRRLVDTSPTTALHTPPIPDHAAPKVSNSGRRNSAQRPSLADATTGSVVDMVNSGNHAQCTLRFPYRGMAAR